MKVRVEQYSLLRHGNFSLKISFCVAHKSFKLDGTFIGDVGAAFDMKIFAGKFPFFNCENCFYVSARLETFLTRKGSCQHVSHLNILKCF